MNPLTLGPGSSLNWHDIQDHTEQEFTTTDVAERAIEFLFEPVALSPRLTVGDVLGLLDRCPDLCKVFRRDFAEEICAEACKGPLPQQSAADSEAGGIEFVELYWSWRQNSSNAMFSGTQHLGLHGLGPVQQVDVPDLGAKAGERVKWSLSFTPLRELLALPLRLNQDMRIVEDDMDAYAYDDPIATAQCAEVLLGQVIRGVLYELSFHGGPQAQAELREELQSRADEVKGGAGECVSLDDLFSDLDRPGFETLFESLGSVPQFQVSRALREIPDAEPVGAYLAQMFEGQVVVKSQFNNRPGREFRKIFRTAGR